MNVRRLEVLGVVLRNDRGEFLAALSTKVTGIVSALLGEILAAREAAVFAQQQRFPLLELEGDALLGINALSHKGGKDSSPFGHILDDTRRILENQAQGLAMLGLKQHSLVIWFEESSDVILNLLVEDIN
ncbi:hypothetical protein D8674_000361 [Pyrus ussuriensis x Pyrus communis]|uniref:RNase H type-1 domain-containing protein n=1 Tax=Pyrus ussuriensis x Pyrus communis TaxID=2448454 RepID=A0A5N5F5T2_9ROSA|nr:hypothetical protein D8674_000361 [Pyrus ussuriensis x Pyrus communis]